MGSAEPVHRPKRGSMTQSPKLLLRSKHGVPPRSTLPGLASDWSGRARTCHSSEQLCRDQSAPDEEVIRRIAVIARLREFFAALTAYAEAYEAVVSGEKPEPRPIGFAHSNDPVAALWTGLRAALAVFVVSSFWILTNWAHGSTAAVLGAVATARLATMAPAVPIAVGATLIFALATIPAFIIVEVLLPLADGFAMFALAVAPMLFLCAFLMAHKKTMLIGYLSALLFASAGQFLDQMVYDPVGILNTCIAAVVAAATAMVLWAIIAPATPEAARRRFVRAARRALARIAARRRRIGLTEFETAMTEALGQLRGQLRPDQPDDIAAYEAAIALFGAGRELIRVREDRASLCHGRPRTRYRRARRQPASAVARPRSTHGAGSCREVPCRTARGRGRCRASAVRCAQDRRLRCDPRRARARRRIAH